MEKKNNKWWPNKDQPKPNHHEAKKGHRTRKHYLNTINEEEAKEEIRDFEKDE
jgi:hypothetical protein